MEHLGLVGTHKSVWERLSAHLTVVRTNVRQAGGQEEGLLRKQEAGSGVPDITLSFSDPLGFA